MPIMEWSANDFQGVLEDQDIGLEINDIIRFFEVAGLIEIKVERRGIEAISNNSCHELGLSYTQAIRKSTSKVQRMKKHNYRKCGLGELIF